MADKISQLIESTAQLMDVISYMRVCEEKTIYQLKDEVTHASITLFFLLDYATLPRMFQYYFNKYCFRILFNRVATLPGNLEFDNLGKKKPGKTWNLGNFEKKNWKNLEFGTKVIKKPRQTLIFIKFLNFL